MPTTEGVVQLPPDGSGKKLRAQTGGTMPADTYAEVLVLQNPSGDLVSPAQDGADGDAPPPIPGSGIRGWLRSIYDKLAGTLQVSVTSMPEVEVKNDAGAPLAVAGIVAVSNPTTNPETGLAKDATLTARWKAATGGPTLVNTNAADQVIYDPAPGKRPRLKWLYAATPDDAGANVIVTVKIGASAVYQFPLGVCDVFSHGSIREGALDELITVTLSVARPVYFNVDCEDF